ncbi:MAG: hypothetical protein U0133_06730 [Gemmatimonadales bacterium]
MTISGSSPLGGAVRVANAYGIAPRPAPAAPAKSTPSTGTDSVTLSARAAKPAGIPLSSVLNDEERAYFDQLEAMGPITYGRTGKGGMVPDAPRGVRLDVRG